MKKKHYLFVALGILAVGATLFLVLPAKAEESNSSQPTFAHRLAEKLGLSDDKVQNALKDVRSDMANERLTMLSGKLDQAVKDGVITADQKQKIVDKFQELKTERKSERGELKQWMKDSGIDFSKLRNYMFGEGGFHHKKFGSVI